MLVEHAGLPHGGARGHQHLHALDVATRATGSGTGA